MPPSRSHRTASPTPRLQFAPTCRPVDWGEYRPLKKVRTKIDTLCIRAVVTVTDAQAVASVFNRTHAAPKHLRRHLYRKRRHFWYSDESLGIYAGFCENHPGPKLPRYANAVVLIGGAALLRHHGDHAAAWREVVALFARAGLRIVDHQLSSVDLAVDFVEWGVARDESLISRLKAARDQGRIKTRAKVHRRRRDWGIKITARAFAARFYDLTRRLSANQRHQYERGIGESVPTPSKGVHTRVELTARRQVLLACSMNTLDDLDNLSKRGGLVRAFRRHLRVALASSPRKIDPDWLRVLGALRDWSSLPPRTTRASGGGEVTTPRADAPAHRNVSRALDKSPNLAHQRREGRDPRSLHNRSRPAGALSDGNGRGPPGDAPLRSTERLMVK